MAFRRPFSVAPDEPSTSTASQRRHDKNRETFDFLFPKEAPPTLWQVCQVRKTGKLAKYNWNTESRALRGVNFKVLLKDDYKYLSDVAEVSGTSYAELCARLRFFAFFKKLPIFGKNEENAKEFFRLVANCIVYKDDDWCSDINTSNLMHKRGLTVLKKYGMCSSVEPREPIIKETCPGCVDEQEIRRLDFDESRRHHEITHPRIRDVDLKKWSKNLEKLRKLVLNLQIGPRFVWSPLQDEHLRIQHIWDEIGMNDQKFNAVFSDACRKMAENNCAYQKKEDLEMDDMKYYGGDVELPPGQISFRIDTVMQVVNFELPKISEEGYFPPSRLDNCRYLYESYQKSSADCLKDFQIISPQSPKIPTNFKLDFLKADELYIFHILGRHIHGFFQVWQETDRGWRGNDGNWVSRRYLVDVYNHIMFPLYVGLKWWPKSLIWAFDKYSMYALRLMVTVKKRCQDLKLAGDSLFIRYPSRINERYDLSILRGRNQFYSLIQSENSRIVERFLGGRSAAPVFKMPIDDGGPGKRRKSWRKSSEEFPQNVTRRIPRKSTEPPVSALPTTSQKPSAEIPSTTSPQKRKLSASASTAMDLLTPPTKKSGTLMMNSWDRTNHAEEEEHVDEESEDPKNQNVWVPPDRGSGVAPEQYAKEILAHYHLGSSASSSSSSSSLATPLDHQKPPSRKPRKSSTQLPKGGPPIDISFLSQPLAPCPSQAPPPPPQAPPPSGPQIPPGKTTRLLYSIKQPPVVTTPPKTVYPVKKLATAQVPMPSAPLPAPPATQIPGRTGSYSLQQKAPYYPTGMRAKIAQPIQIQNQPIPSENSQPTSSSGSSQPSTSSSASSTSTSSAGIQGIQKTSSRLLNTVQNPPPPTPKLDQFDPSTASIDEILSRDPYASVDYCRRTIPYNLQMIPKGRLWTPPPKSASVPPKSTITAPPPRAQSHAPSTTVMPVQQRPRSLSTRPPPTNPPPTVPPKARPVPWTAQRMVAAAVASMRQSAEKIAPGPILMTPAAPISQNARPAPSPVAPPTRKPHGGLMTPEELGDAIRTESQRIQENDGGSDEGPSVKNFLMKIKHEK